MSAPPRTDLARALRRYVAAVSLGGVAVLVAAALSDPDRVVPLTDPGILIFAACIALAECFPVRLSRSGEFTASTTFTFALLWLYGLEAALLVQAAASVLADVLHRKPLTRVLFNVGQSTLSYAVAGLVFELVIGHAATGAKDLDIVAGLPALLLSGLVFFAVNQPLATAAPAMAERSRLRDALLAHWQFEATTTAILVGFAPIVVAIAAYDRALMPLLGLPLIAVHLGGRQSVAMEYQALHDALTGLPNRVLFRRDVETALEDGAAAVLVMDLDRFKEVNDTLGHGHGDLLLVAVARRLRPVLSEEAALARLGGDEFAVLLPDAGGEAAAEVARELLEAVRAPFAVEGMALEVGTSIGVACAPDDGEDVETLMKRADIAMYTAKERRTGW